ncbi:helicase-associated domain-containing protein [Saccharopolyspora sp. HNM0983]|uniref:Helicase-associated domain-containing protein n=1 Tax=Saccharopolyspora montiporae TaxID=2781240 RepID=A0A929FWX8_9PSEU|nr:helicase-associated domain-containing protein [Saccharopolyspora sp. HNM0983]MBE9374046.1 helicase-associated domain-containing protein [Saccharopolyspora sp. HNM0983]
MADLADWLRGRSDEQLVALLRARPDLATPSPADTAVLATRAAVRSSVARACEDLDSFALSALEALVLLDADTAPVAPADAADLLGEDVTEPQLRRTIDELRALALVWGEEELRIPQTAREVLPSFPAGLGRPAAELTSDGARAALDAMDEAERELVGKLAGDSPLGRTKDAGKQVPLDEAQNPVQRLLARGLLLRHDAENVELPRQLALAVRGDRPMGEIEALEPVPEVVERGRDVVDETAAGAVLELLRHVEGLLHDWGEDPPDVLRSGGVGVRDLRRTAKTVDVDENRLALLVELAAGANLIANSEGAAPRWVPTYRSDNWLSAPPEQRWALLAQTWLDLPRLPGLVGARDEKDRLIGPLSEELRRPVAPQDRRRVLDYLDELPGGCGVPPSSVRRVLTWRTPRRGGRVRDDQIRWALGEATALGIVALDALTGAGRALLSDGSAEAARALGAALPEPLDHVLVQADLTVVAPGRLEPDLAAELKLVADVESAGSATVYRVSEASVRRALDAGYSADDLHALFRDRSRTPVPQSLTYLVDDVSRKHGRLRAGTAAAFLRCDDPVLLSEVLAKPGTEDLQLRRIAPTVLVSQLPLADVVDGLREAGFTPVAEGPDGNVLDLRTSGHRVRGGNRTTRAPVQHLPGPEQLAELVTQLRAGDRAGTARRGSTVTPERGRPSAEATLRLLRDAATQERDVWLGFVDTHGVRSQRVVRPVTVGGGILRGRDADNGESGDFPLHRITSVALIED